MEPDQGEAIKPFFANLRAEIRKDYLFFGACGVAVGLSMVAHSLLEESRYVHGRSLADKLFADFVPFHAFGFLMIGLITISAVAKFISSLGWHWPKLEATVRHVQTRLIQIVSSTIPFTLGLAVVALATKTASGRELTAILGALDFFLFAVLFAAVSYYEIPNKYLDTWWGAAIVFFIVGGGLLGLLIG